MQGARAVTEGILAGRCQGPSRGRKASMQRGDHVWVSEAVHMVGESRRGEEGFHTRG